MRHATCIECGEGFDVHSDFGPLPRRCPSHTLEYNRAEAALRRKRASRKVRRPPDLACADCGEALSWNGVGRPKVRCSGCAALRNQELGRRRSLKWLHSNPEHARQLQRQRYQRNADSIKERKLEEHYRRKYGITTADRDRMLEEQGGKCAICSGGPHPAHHGQRLHVDHCHETGAIRALLCGNCNTMIGLADEDPARLLAAAEYLRKHKS